MNVEKFCAYWPRAIKQGWELTSIHQNLYPHTYMVQAPVNSTPVKEKWAATYTTVYMNGISIIVPHWLAEQVEQAK